MGMRGGFQACLAQTSPLAHTMEQAASIQGPPSQCHPNPKGYGRTHPFVQLSSLYSHQRLFSLPPFRDEWTSVMHRCGAFEKNWAGWTSFSSQQRESKQVAVSSLESRFYKGQINKWWPQRENPAKLTQPQRRAHRPGAGKLGLHQPSLLVQVNWDEEDKTVDMLIRAQFYGVHWPSNKVELCLPTPWIEFCDEPSTELHQH